MDRLFLRLVAMGHHYARWVVGILALLAVLGVIFIAGRISIDTDLAKLISDRLPWRLTEAELDRAFPQNTDLIAIVIDGPDGSVTEDATARLAARLSTETSLFRSVRRPDAGEFFERHGLLFLPTQEIQDFADQIITAQPLIGTLAADPSARGALHALDLAVTGVREGASEASILDRPARLFAAAIDAALEGRAAPLAWQSLVIARKPDPHELRRFVLAQPRLDFAALQPGERAETAIREAATSLDLTAARGLRVRITGPVALQDAEFSTISEGATLSGTLSVGLLLILLMAGLRSLRLVAAIMITLMVGLIACGVFAVGVIGTLNPISVAFAVLFTGIAVDFGIQFGVRYREELQRDGNSAEALQRTGLGIGRALTIAAIATAAGFLAFVPTDYTGVRDLGFIAGFGMIIALLLNLTLLPALLRLMSPPRGLRPFRLHPLAVRLNNYLIGHRAPLLAAGLLGVMALLCLPALRFDFNPLHMQNPRAEAVSTITDLATDSVTTPYTIEILTPPNEVETLTRQLSALPEVAQIRSVMSLIPEDQSQKLAILNDAGTVLGPSLHPATTSAAPSEDEVLAEARHLAEDLQAIPGEKPPGLTRLISSLDRLQRSAAPLLGRNLGEGIAPLLGTLRLMFAAGNVTLETLPADIKRDWIAGDGRVLLEIVPAVDTRSNEALGRFSDEVRRIAPSATGTAVTIRESARSITRAFIIAGAAAFLAIALILWLTLRRWLDVVLVLVPLALAGLFTLATAALLGFALNFANIIALPILLGVGVAFDIYLVVRWREGKRDLLQSSTAHAMLFSALTTATAFGSLALSSHLGTASMGKLLTLALFYTIATTFLVLPSLLAAFTPAREADGPG